MNLADIRRKAQQEALSRQQQPMPAQVVSASPEPRAGTVALPAVEMLPEAETPSTPTPPVEPLSPVPAAGGGIPPDAEAIALAPAAPVLPGHRFDPLAVILAVCALTGAAAGHAMLQRTEPRVESRVKRSPDEVKLYFNEPIEPAYSSVRVVNDRGQQVDRRDSRVDSSNPVLLRVTLPDLPPGTYRVRWRVLSVDADVTEGGFTFRIE